MSPLEEKLLDQIAAAGLPMPVTQFKFQSEQLWTKHNPPRLTLWWFDLCWPRYRLVVEVDGATWANGRHNRGAGYESDCEKCGEAGERDWTVLRFTGLMVKDGRAIARIRRIISHRQQVRWICVDQEVGAYSREEAE
jgi:very-short-patch-repair endonuclease